MTSPFAWHPASPVMITGDGALVLAYDSLDQGPKWMTPAPAIVKSVVSSATHVFALCDGGVIAQFSLATGEKLSTQNVADARALLITANGSLAIVTPAGLMFDATTLAAADAVGAAFSGDGAQAAVVTSDGVVHLFDVASAKELRTLAISSPAKANGVWWNPSGKCWLVTAGTHVKNVSADLSSVDIFISFEKPFDTLAVEQSGRIVAARAEKTVLLVGFPKRQMIGSLSYFDKSPGQLAFGPAPWVGVGIDLGDANTVDLTQEGVCRTDPHAGRPRNRWMLSVSVKPEKTAEAMASAAPKPVAVAPMPAVAAAAPIVPAKRGFSMPAFVAVLLVLGALALIAMR